MTGCPHGETRFCPLYVAAHAPGAPSCIDGRIDEGTCAVDRGADYGELLAALSAGHPRLVAEVALYRDAAQRHRQRALNMRAAGVH